MNHILCKRHWNRRWNRWENCFQEIRGADSYWTKTDATSTLLIIPSLYLANIFTLYISCQLSLVLLFIRGEYFMLVTRWRQYSFHTQSSTAPSMQKQDSFQCLHGTERIWNHSGLKLDLIFLVLQFVWLTVLEFVWFHVKARPNCTNWWTVKLSRFFLNLVWFNCANGKHLV